MLPVAVLNLKRRRDRRKTFEHNNQQTQIEFVWVDAVDGQQLEFSQLLQQNLITSRASHFSPGHIGCALSHRQMWETCVKKMSPLIICEDDAILRKDFATIVPQLIAQLPTTWELLLLGYNFDSILDVEIIPGIDLHGRFIPPRITHSDHQAHILSTRRPTVLPLNNAFGNCAYVVSPQGSAKLIQRCFPLTRLAVGVPSLNRVLHPAVSIDAIMNAHYRQLQAFCSIPPVAMTPNLDSDTR